MSVIGILIDLHILIPNPGIQKCLSKEKLLCFASKISCESDILLTYGPPRLGWISQPLPLEPYLVYPNNLALCYTKGVEICCVKRPVWRLPIIWHLQKYIFLAFFYIYNICKGMVSILYAFIKPCKCEFSTVCDVE